MRVYPRAQVQASRNALRLARKPTSNFDRLLSVPLRLATSSDTEAASLGPRDFRGSVAVYGNLFYCFDRKRWDVVATVIEPGAFAKSIAEINSRANDLAGNIPLLYEHWSLLGHTTALEDTPTDVRVTATVTDARELDLYLAWIKDRTLNGLSAGFNVLASTKVTIPDVADGEEVEHVTEASLGEATVCLWAANELAMIDQVASRLARPDRAAAAAGDDESISKRLVELNDQLRTANARLDAQQADLDILTALAGLRKG